MLRPDRHTNPDFSVINLSAYILNKLNAHYALSYDSLLRKVIDELGENSKENYPYALNFLFLMGKIEYQQNSDGFKLIK
ncbi:MAG: hypothetical protein Q3M30_13845 [Candidatus Electrothrix sp. Rat3]|nr:hypothetical protein [Candidatus Electrothrix rattekaaiensis]